MKTEIKDYIHLYLWADCIVDGWMKSMATWHKKIVGYDAEGGIVTVLFFISESDYEHCTKSDKCNLPIRDIKPILRRLESMTEMEAENLLLIIMQEPTMSEEEQVTYDEIVFDRMLEPDKRWAIEGEVSVRCFEGKFGASHNGDLYLCDEEDKPQFIANQAQATSYLLSKGFDLFGLIDSQQAIERT